MTQLPGEKLVIKLWETLAKGGVGSLLAPWQIKRVGRARTEVRCEELLMLAQAEKSAQDIREGRSKLLEDGRLVQLQDGADDKEQVDEQGRIEPTLFLERSSERAANFKRAEEIQQEININKTIYLAEEELLRSRQEPSDKEVDPDWLFRWREHAKNTNNDQLRDIWAKTLAGEVKSPGSYSLRTLEFIRNISQEEALAVSLLGQFAIKRSIFKTKRLEEVGVNFGFLLQMDDLGILHGVQGGELSGLQIKFQSQSKEKFFFPIVNRNLVLIVEGEDPSKVLSLGCYQISKVGAELLSLGDFHADEGYMRELGAKIKEQGFKVLIAHYVQTSPDGGQYFNSAEI